MPSFFAALQRWAREAGHAVAAMDGVALGQADAGGGAEPSGLAARVTYAELCAHAEALAGVLNDEVSSVTGTTAGPNAGVLATAMQRGNCWYCTFWACARLQVPMVALSLDLPDKDTELRRNADILIEHRPILIVLDSPGGCGDRLEEIVGLAEKEVLREFRELWRRATLMTSCKQPLSSVAGGLEDAPLCYNYTGGTTKASRCACITHRMALHEVETYPHVIKLGNEDRILQQHSLYWAASAYGEVDVALAFGCTLVFAEAWDPDAVVAAIQQHEISCVGLVPSILASLDHSRVPSLRCVFTWGEALQIRVAHEWSRHVQLIDLLISTECWLSLYADWSRARDFEQPLFQVVPGTQVRLKPVDGDGAEGDGTEAGELLVSGPMVCAGYTDANLNGEAFELDTQGVRWYRTKDCVQSLPGGFRFAGRADDLVKVGGAWVDTRDVERRLRGVAAVADVCICRRDAFVVLQSLADGAVAALRSLLPPDFALFIVPSLPTCAGTGKVDRRRLHALVGPGIVEERKQREAKLNQMEKEQLLRWYRPLWFIAIASVLHHVLSDEVVATLMAPLSFVTLALWIILDFACRLLCFTYMILPLWHMPGWVEKKLRNFFLGEYGVAIALSMLLPSPGPGRPAPGAWQLLLCATVLPGLYFAAKRRRVLSWPLVCLLGYPIWSRDANWWLGNYSIRELVVYYVPPPCVKNFWRLFRDDCLQGCLVQPSKRRAGNLLRFARLARDCAWCKKLHPRWQGHFDPQLATAATTPLLPAPPERAGQARAQAKRRPPRWYCEKCWSSYDSHRQCVGCKKWAVPSGPMGADAAAAFLCKRCQPQPLATTPRGGGGGASSRGSSPGSPGARQAKGAGSRGSSPGGLPTQRRPILVTPEPAVHKRGLATCESPREGTPARRRRRISNGVVSNGHDIADVANGDYSGEGANGHGGAEGSPPAKQRRLGRSQERRSPNSRPRSESSRSPKRRGLAVATSAAPPAAVEKSREWQMVEEATGTVFGSLDDSLAALDSLRLTKLTGAAKRRLGKRLSRQALKMCQTLGSLLDTLERLPSDGDAGEASATTVAAEDGREYAAWGMMWSSRCQWTLRCNGRVPQEELRRAMQTLIIRHPALRAELRDPYRLFVATQQALSALTVWRKRGVSAESRAVSRRGIFGLASDLIGAAVRWSLGDAWPRVAAGRVPALDEEQVLKVLEPSAKLEDAEWKLWRQGSNFQPPFMAVLAPYGSGGEEGALLMIIVTHMLSDGYSVVPLLEDLSSLVPLIGDGRSVLPQVPSMMEAIERRINRTIEDRDDDEGQGLVPKITPQTISGRRHWRANMVYATLPVEAVTAIRNSAQRLAVPVDIAALSVLGVALAWFSGNRTEVVAMIVPQRDGPGENDMVGLLSDIRHFGICTDGLSFAGIALRLHHVVKERLWRVPGLLTQWDITQVNFEWTDFQERRGYVQHARQREYPEGTSSPLRVAIDQQSPDAWRLRVAFQEGRYDEAARERFFQLFETSLHALRDRPLDLAWPA